MLFLHCESRCCHKSEIRIAGETGRCREAGFAYFVGLSHCAVHRCEILPHFFVFRIEVERIAVLLGCCRKFVDGGLVGPVECVKRGFARIHNLQYLEELVDAWPLRGIGVQFNHIIAQELELRLEFEFGRFEGTEYLAVVCRAVAALLEEVGSCEVHHPVGRVKLAGAVEIAQG